MSSALSIWGADGFSGGVEAGVLHLPLQGAGKKSKNPSPPVGLGLMGGLFGRLRLVTVSRRTERTRPAPFGSMWCVGLGIEGCLSLIVVSSFAIRTSGGADLAISGLHYLQVFWGGNDYK